MNYLIFDVESIGLHGEGFAVGWVLLDEKYNEIDVKGYYCDPAMAWGYYDDYQWVKRNCNFDGLEEVNSPKIVRAMFWENSNAMLIADCAWPVETRFLNHCIKDGYKDGPYPLFDLSSMLWFNGIDPLKEYPRLDNELPKHNPINDARQSARLFRALMRG